HLFAYASSPSLSACLCRSSPGFLVPAPATPETYTLSLHDALPILRGRASRVMSAFLEQLPVRAAALKRRIVFAEGHDERTIHAIARLQRAGIMQVIALGSQPAELRRAVDAAEGDGDGVVVLDPARDGRRERYAAELLERRKHRGMTRAEALERVSHPLYFAA